MYGQVTARTWPAYAVRFDIIITILDSAENEIQYIIVTATEKADKGERHIAFPLPTFQNPEEGGNKPPKRGL